MTDRKASVKGFGEEKTSQMPRPPSAVPVASSGSPLKMKGTLKGGSPPAVGSSVAVDMKTLNHRNMPKAFEEPKRVTTYPLPPKVSRVPGMRAYPGQMTVTHRGAPRGAIYAEDLEREEREMNEKFLHPSYELSREDLLRHNDFLKIDQSKLPLEMFDNVEFADKDLTPQQWIASGSAGKSPYFHNGSWLWRNVQVLSYDDTKGEFTVKFMPDGIEKTVRRLNLQFDQEDPVIFNERKRIAEEARDEAKRIIRLDHFILQQPREFIQPIRQNNIRSIHEKIIDGLPRDMPFPSQDSALGQLLRTLTGDLILFYARTMKRTVLFAKMEGVYRDEKTVVHYNELKLPAVPTRPPVPMNGKVPCPGIPPSPTPYSFSSFAVLMTYVHPLIHAYIHFSNSVHDLYKSPLFCSNHS